MPDLYQALPGIQRVIEDGASCLKIGQQRSVVRGALDSTHRRTTVCLMSQEPESRHTCADEQRADPAVMMKDLKALLARVG